MIAPEERNLYRTPDSLLMGLRNRDIEAMSKFAANYISMGLVAVALVSVFLLSAACQTTKFEPVSLAPEDMCSYCRMAISEKQFAAEVIDGDSRAFKFDDIGCMVDFVEGKKNEVPIAAYFVMDFDKREWIKGEDAYYVRAPEVLTPMSGGVIAFSTQSQAQQAVDKYQGTLLRWRDIVR